MTISKFARLVEYKFPAKRHPRSVIAALAQGLSVSIPSALVAVSNMPSASETTISRKKNRPACLGAGL